MQYCLPDCREGCDEALPPGLHVDTQCSIPSKPECRSDATKYCMQDCSQGLDAALPPRLLTWTRCSIACRTRGWDVMQHCLPDCRYGRDAALPAGLESVTRWSTAGITAGRLDEALPPRLHNWMRCSIACRTTGTYVMQHCLPDWRQGRDAALQALLQGETG